MRENIRSGRRANFYITENSFIDNYAKAVGPRCAVVYNVLERYMNSETRSTWVGTKKMAEVIGVDQRTVQRCLKTLEEFKLIKILRTASATTYVVLPVPTRPKEATIPLFEAVSDMDVLWKGDAAVADATQASFATTEVSHYTTATSQTGDTDDAANKEEQNLFNKTYKQETPELNETAQRILRTLKLPETYTKAAKAAIDDMLKRTTLSMDGIVGQIVTAANHAERNGTEKQEFLEDFLAKRLAEEILGEVHQPKTHSLISTVAAAIKAEATYKGLAVENVAALIKTAALEDIRRGTTIDRFYFENVKWRQEGRSNVRPNRAEQRKLDNLEANARAKQRLRERLGVS